MKKRNLMMGIIFMGLCLILATNANAAPLYYTCSVEKIIAFADGKVRLQIYPGVGETRFTELSKVDFDGTTSGGKNMLAQVLTAVSLGSDLYILLNSLPSSTTQVSACIGLVSP